MWLLLCEQFAPDATEFKSARQRYEAAAGTAEEGQAEVIVDGLHLPLGRGTAGLRGPGRTGQALWGDARDGGRATGALAGAIGADGAQGGLAAVAAALLGPDWGGRRAQHRQRDNQQRQGQHRAGGGWQGRAAGERQR